MAATSKRLKKQNKGAIIQVCSSGAVGVVLVVEVGCWVWLPPDVCELVVAVAVGVGVGLGEVVGLGSKNMAVSGVVYSQKS